MQVLRVEIGSMKEDLQCLSLRVFSMCLLNNIKLEVEWIPRSPNDRANLLSRIVDYDDCRVKRDYFLMAEAKWGPHSVDRFASHENAQLPRFRGRGTLVVPAWPSAPFWSLIFIQRF